MYWSDVFFTETVDDKVQLVQDKLASLFDSCFPTISVRVSSRDPPFVSPLVKHLLNERRKLLRQDGSSMAIQTLIKKINALIRRNQLLAVKNDINDKDKGSKSWWSIIRELKQQTFAIHGGQPELKLHESCALRMSHGRRGLSRRAPRNFSRPCRFATTFRLHGFLR